MSVVLKRALVLVPAIIVALGAPVIALPFDHGKSGGARIEDGNRKDIPATVNAGGSSLRETASARSPSITR